MFCGEKKTQETNLVNIYAGLRLRETNPYCSIIRYKKTTRKRRASRTSSTEGHSAYYRASWRHQTGSATHKHAPDEVARFLEHGMWDCPRQTG